MEKLKAPFPYFGGKSRVAHIVWDVLGDVAHYIEPFFGSGAVLLARPNYNPKRHTETVNDKDGFIANVWRAIAFAPDEVAKYCDWPVNHADLAARRKRLIENEDRLLENLIADEEWFDAKLAGYWIWAASCWIGRGLTRGNTDTICQRPHLANAGIGVHGKSQNVHDTMASLSSRLRRVRVTCGDWIMVCGGNWQDRFGTVGIFFDPPYGVIDRDQELYHCESNTVASDVLDWCKERGSRSTHRIVIAGYEEYQELVDEYGWTFKQWKTGGGYSNIVGKPNDNSYRELFYFSPHCNRQDDLFSSSRRCS